MMPLLITCTVLTAAISTATILFLRKLTRPWFSIEVDISKAMESLDRLSKSMHLASLAFMAFSASVNWLENPELKNWAKEQP